MSSSHAGAPLTAEAAREEWALARDAADPLAWCRAEFELPTTVEGTVQVYFCGNSLGLMPKAARANVLAELDDWARLGVLGHLEAKTPWYSYHERLREPLARVVGARSDEVVAMNSLTVNLHLMLATFYRPVPGREKIVMEQGAFPSDRYAVTSHLRTRGLDPARSLLLAHPRPGEAILRTEDLESLLLERGREIALLLLPGVHFVTGQLIDMGRVALAAREAGVVVGYDLAHAAGNVALKLHDWNVDFAVWCSYKYLNGGPGAVGGCFVHQRHGRDGTLPRYAGWWGNDPETRFQMHRNPEFIPVEGADGWQLSNPPILAMAPLLAALDLFERSGMPALRAKSEQLTGYLEFLLTRLPAGRLELITPRDPGSRGCQLSIRVPDAALDLFDTLQSRGFLGDFREPDVIRFAPAPLYNTFHEVWRLGQALEQQLRSG